MEQLLCDGLAEAEMNKLLKITTASLLATLCSAFCPEAESCTATPVSDVRTAVQQVLDNARKPEEMALAGDLFEMWFDMCAANRRQRRYLVLLRPLMSRPGVNGDIAVMINDAWRDALFLGPYAESAYAEARQRFWRPGRVMSTGPEIQHLTFWQCLSARLNNRPIPANVCDDLDESSRQAANWKPPA
jgi:hypothetical protein